MKLAAWWAAPVVPAADHDKWEEAGEVPRALWEEAGEAGLLGLTIPEEYGGAGASILHAAVMWEEQSYAGVSGPGFQLHSEIVMPYILNYGNRGAEANSVLPQMAAGKMITAIAMTEPGAGSDLQGMRTTALKDGDDYIINGSKTFITNGWMADLVLVCAKTDPAAGAKGISIFAVPATTPGYHRGKKLKKLGLRAQDTAELFFEDMRVPR